MGSWLTAETKQSAIASIAQDCLHSANAVACASVNRPIMSKQMFGRRLRALRPEVQEAQRTADGKRQWVLPGGLD
jgi:hypothetical protein